MRNLAIALLAFSLLIVGARLCTGIVYLTDEPTVALVLKRAPAAWIEQSEAEGLPLAAQIVLDRDEADLLYGQPYRSLMQAVPILASILAGASALSMVMAGRRRQSH